MLVSQIWLLYMHSASMGDQPLPKLLREQFDTLPSQCRHMEHIHEGVWFKSTSTAAFDAAI